MTTTDETPLPCDCCHAEDGAWRPVPLTREALSDPAMQESPAMMRLLTHALGVDGRLHLTAVAQGLFEGGSLNDDDETIECIALLPDPEAPGMSPSWRETAEAALQRRRDALAAGEEPGRELWGPLVAGEHVLQVAR